MITTCVVFLGCKAAPVVTPGHVAEKFPPVDAAMRTDGDTVVKAELILTDPQKRSAVIDIAASKPTHKKLCLHVDVWGPARSGNPEVVTPDGTVWKLALIDLPADFHGQYGVFEGTVPVPRQGEVKVRWMSVVNAIDRVWKKGSDAPGSETPATGSKLQPPD